MTIKIIALKRLAICNQCEYYTMLMCKKCGCFMPAKVRIKSSICPVNKWLPEN